MDVRCAKGTYVRSLARDIARALGTVGHVTHLRRTESSGFNVEAACGLDAFRDSVEVSSFVLPLERGLPHLAKITLDDREVKAIRFGQVIDVPEGADVAEAEPAALLTPRQTLACIAVRSGNALKPVRVFPV